MREGPYRQLIVALDFDRLAPASDLAQRIADLVGMFKVGSTLFTAEGPSAVLALARLGTGIFLDLKFHDIPNTVAGAVSAAANLPSVRLMTLHALGGVDMMRAAKKALSGYAVSRRPKLLAVTLLTSLDAAEMAQVGLSGQPGAQALKLAVLAREAGLDGVVASAHEAKRIRSACGPRLVIVVPGVRPAADAPRDDQTRVATPAETIRAGANYIVVGRPITAAPDPRAAAMAIIEEMAQAQHRHI